MHFIRGLYNLTPSIEACIATIGNFDGVHLGHQAIFTELLKKSAELNLPALVILFEPQPREYFLKEKSPPRLTRLREKLLFMKNYGVNQVLCLHFNQKLAQLNAKEFISSILINNLHVKYLMVGEDFRFGCKREGDYELLHSIATNHGVIVRAHPTVNLEGEKISSTKVREALQQGNMKLSVKLLGRDFSLCGRVRHGEKRGRQWGVPTANVMLHRKILPLQGVYVVKVAGIDNELVAGVANVGNRPTLSGTRSLLEVHLFDFDRDIYGQNIEVIFLNKLREEKRFETIELLKQQIFHDIELAKNYFKHSMKG